MNGRFRGRWSFLRVEHTVEWRERDSAGTRRWYLFQGWAVAGMLAVALVGFAASLVAIALDRRTWPAAVVFGFLAIPSVLVLNAATLFARVRRASPERYALETHDRGFVAHLGWCGRSLLSVLHDSVVRLSAAAAALPPGVRRHARATLVFHRIAFGLLIAAGAGALVAAVYLRLSQ